MTKMDMIWVATAELIHPNTDSAYTVSRHQIEQKIRGLFGADVVRVMIEKHLVSFVPRMADKGYPPQGGSRNRYLFRTTNGFDPDEDGNYYRLSKEQDRQFDGRDKTGKLRPERDDLEEEFHYLLDWHEKEYYSDSD